MKVSESEIQALRERFLREGRHWRPLQEGLARFDPEWLDIYGGIATGALLSLKLRHLIWVAVDASTTHLYETGIRHHAILAQKSGATREEIFEALQVTTEAISLSPKAALPILMEELHAAGREDEIRVSAALSDEQKKMKEDFIKTVGCWPAWLEWACRAMPEFAAVYCRLAARPYKTGTLSSKERALISVAVYAAPTTLHEPSIRDAVRLALRHGATGGEIAEAIWLASGIGLHTMAIGAPAVLKAIDGIDIPQL